LEVPGVTDMRPEDIPGLVRQVLGDSLGYLYPAALRVAVRLRVADLLAEGPRTPAELAEAAGVSADHLGRVLRFLATRGVFADDGTGRFALTPVARLLRADSPVALSSIVMLFTDDTYWRPAGRLEDTVRTGSTVFREIFGAPFFDHVLGAQERRDTFDTALADLSILEQGAIADSYSFPPTGTVVDVAGGRGGMLHAVLRRNPGLHGVLFDREPVLRNHRLDDPEIEGRWRTVAGDFTAEVPASGDVYLLKRILHDKNDDECLAVLRTCRRAMSDSARLLVIDPVIPAGSGPHPHVLSDILMMTVWDGRERTEDELGQLLADAEFKLNGVTPTPSGLSIAAAGPA
jgi:hypothetical protein